MVVVNMHDAKTQLSKLVEQAVQGQPFVIARAGKPLVWVTAVDAPPVAQPQRTGFMKGQIALPDDFDQMGGETIDKLFDGR